MSMVYISEDGRKAYFDPTPLGAAAQFPSATPAKTPGIILRTPLTRSLDQCCQACHRRFGILPGVPARCAHWVRDQFFRQAAVS